MLSSMPGPLNIESANRLPTMLPSGMQIHISLRRAASWPCIAFARISCSMRSRASNCSAACNRSSWGMGHPHRALTARFWPQRRAGATGAGPASPEPPDRTPSLAVEQVFLTDLEGLGVRRSVWREHREHACGHCPVLHARAGSFGDFDIHLAHGPGGIDGHDPAEAADIFVGRDAWVVVGAPEDVGTSRGGMEGGLVERARDLDRLRAQQDVVHVDVEGPLARCCRGRSE